MMIVEKLCYIAFSYLVGSLLFSELFMQLFCHKSLFVVSKNHNPGSSNAFKYGSVPCGILSVIFDVGKGALVVFLYRKLFRGQDIGLTLAMLAVMLGHAYSIFYSFRGGMCIAVSFGVLLGLLPQFFPLACLIVLYLMLLLFKRGSNGIVTEIVYVSLAVLCIAAMLLKKLDPFIGAGTIFVSFMVCLRIWTDLSSDEQEFIRRLVHRKHE